MFAWTQSSIMLEYPRSPQLSLTQGTGQRENNLVHAPKFNLQEPFSLLENICNFPRCKNYLLFFSSYRLTPLFVTFINIYVFFV